ncbi:MAG: preprotein translocase subunit SecE [Bacilli bacterium]|mgnify:FL=1|jgi:preprotein translocase SecE subunit|nr:preprotein translocase subunit SecE [Bacilli bacterium]MDD4005866.1 preprotein translocase subunit SecE [Bacilli bacterium]
MGVKKYTAEVVKEGKRVRWPKREELLPTIIVVVVIAAFAAIFLSLEDWAAGSLLQTLKDAFAGWSK